MLSSSSKAISEVRDDIKNLNPRVSVSASGLNRQSQTIEQLKLETAQELQNAFTALLTQNTPPELQQENTAPSEYFHSLIKTFEVQMHQYRQQVEELKNHLMTQTHITPQDLFLAIQSVHQAFAAQVAQLQSVHENVRTLKQKYLSFRRVFLGDSTNVFERRK
ncbi:nucleoporin p58/p45-like [Antennarius striatus]|uniref:nucleoporin p58/p45-like n=1 Tax=Antennarius striatus TaxID=241820 RepID=UPI0035B434C8